MKKILIVLFVIFLGGCMSVKAEPQPHISEDEYRDLLERIALLEEEVGNLKQDLADGFYQTEDGE